MASGEVAAGQSVEHAEGEGQAAGRTTRRTGVDLDLERRAGRGGSPGHGNHDPKALEGDVDGNVSGAGHVALELHLELAASLLGWWCTDHLLGLDQWNLLRDYGDPRYAKAFKGARWCLLKNPEDLTASQTAQLAQMRRTRSGTWRAYEMKEQLRVLVTADDHDRADADVLLDAWCARAQRSRLAPFVKLAKTIRQRRDMILNAIEHGISNGRVEGLNTKVRLIIRRAYGFHSAQAALALVMLAAGPITLHLPHERKNQ